MSAPGLSSLRKRSASALSVDSAKNEPISTENPSNLSISRPKRLRKAPQHHQFWVYQDETSSLDSYSSDSYEESSPVNSARQLGPVDPNIVVEIPFRSEIHRNPGPLDPLEPPQPISAKRGPRGRAVPKKWSEKQPNDHTNPSIPDDSTVDTKLDKLLIPPEEAEELFKGRPVEELLRPLPDFQPILIVEHPSEPQNLPNNQHAPPGPIPAIV
ncbi:hypothetical protein GJ744_000975 [Endocarpon pusillum]|uniref:Uncharacterized protein n=1 Tax=Endocarpon pusillum TaxID=364733 RepID=A0A8H7AD89_9EURO|nr:hypothetical protein GJ744_000975 [Endocarpon pusillum]